MKCARCFEEITVPYHFEGKVFGYSCIKIVNPSAKVKKPKNPVYFIQADSYNIEQKEGSTSFKIAAIINGRKYSDWSFENIPSSNIIVQDNKAFVNAYSFTSLNKLIPYSV